MIGLSATDPNYLTTSTIQKHSYSESTNSSAKGTELKDAEGFAEWLKQRYKTSRLISVDKIDNELKLYRENYASRT